eukprot:4071616-Heterocapsa_arctica.AAC.1
MRAPAEPNSSSLPTLNPPRTGSSLQPARPYPRRGADCHAGGNSAAPASRRDRDPARSEQWTPGRDLHGTT